MTTLSIAGLYAWDDTIFEALHIPDGLDHDIQVANILDECSELEIRITDPAIMKQSMDFWSRGMLPIWTRLYSTTQLEYNPIWNKDGTITETRDLGRSDLETRNLSKSNQETRNLANSNAETRNLARSEEEERDLASTANTTNTGQVSAFNSSTMQNADKQTMTGSGADTGTVTKSGTDTGTVNRTGSDTGTVSNACTDTGTVNRTGTDTGTITRRETGNIGVTTTQQMLKEEREVSQFNIYDVITRAFIDKYCIGVY